MQDRGVVDLLSFRSFTIIVIEPFIAFVNLVTLFLMVVQSIECNTCLHVDYVDDTYQTDEY